MPDSGAEGGVEDIRVPPDAARMRLWLREIRSSFAASSFLAAVPFSLALLELFLPDPFPKIGGVWFWSFEIMALAATLRQWWRFARILRRERLDRQIEPEFLADFRLVAVWEPRALFETVTLFFAVFYFTGMFGPDGLRYIAIPLGVAFFASGIRGTVRARALTRRLLRRYFHQAQGGA
ncbi:MAG: hypothetical protein IJ523_05930 [Succinivibrionaceae bacterium]|nr:hypothetical protein [Succinivibrionaceae bacterium]